jgi:hypothetical protein
MNLLNYIKNEKFTNFNDLKVVLESDTFKLKIKEDTEFPNLFLVHTQESCDFNNKIVRECNGIIMDKNTLGIVCYSFDKCKEDETFDTELNINELYIEDALEGTLVRLFYYNNTWYLSTKKCINAANSKWLSQKNFLELFQESLILLNKVNIYNNLNTSNCYSFILAHPENNIVVNYTSPTLFHIGTRNLQNLEEIYEDIGIQLPSRTLIPMNEITPFIENIKNDISVMREGFIFIDKKYNRQKYRSAIYNNLRNLWGNTNNRFFRYLELRKDPIQLSIYISNFQRDIPVFAEYEKTIYLLGKDILNHYILKYVEKKDIKNPYYFAKLLYKIHGDFLNTRYQTNIDKILVELYNLEPKKLYFIYKHHSVAKVKENNDELNIQSTETMTVDTY